QNNGRKSLETLEHHLKPVRAAFALAREADVTEARIERDKANGLAEGKPPATVNRELAAIKRAFRIGLRQRRISTMPNIDLMAEHNVRQGFFEEPDFLAVQGRLPEYLRPLA